MNQMRFGDYLSELIKANYVSAIQLAKVLSCSPSLVHKWLRNEKTPRLNSPYTGQIVDYLDLTETQQIHLEEAQVYSLKKPPTKVRRPKSTAGNLLRHTASSSRVSVPLRVTHQPIDILPPNLGTIRKQEDTILAAIQLLELTQKIQHHEAETIYLTFQGTQGTFESSALYGRWKDTLRSALQHGWNVCHLVRLDRNAQRSIHLVEDMLAYLGAAGSYNPYYFTRYGSITPSYDLLVIPRVGSLVFFAVEQTDHVDAAIYLPDQQRRPFEQQPSSILLDHFKQLKSQTNRLLTSYATSAARSAFSDAHAFIEWCPGDRFLVKDGLSDITRPASFYEEGSNWLEASCIPGEGQAKSIERWQQRMQAFHRYVQKYTYRDVYPKRAIERLVHQGKYARDYRRINPSFALSLAERLAHLSNIVQMLQTYYPNYQVALIDEHEEGDILRNFWEVKGDHGVILETWCPDDNGQEREVVLTITEGTIAGAFRDYGMELWEKISPRNRDKDYVIWWLEQQIGLP